MEDAMRDLEQLRERGDEQRGRKLGLFAMATSLSVAAVFALSLAMGRRVDEEADHADELTELVLAAPAKGAADARTRSPDVTPESLSFPHTLSDREDPMLEATLQAARAERAGLGGSAEALPVHVGELPAGRLAEDDAARLSRVARHDALVAQAMPHEQIAGRAPVGSEGAFVLQVVSFDDKPEADRFADALRARQHHAFVAQADVPGRGRYYRVRIGPFTTKREAESYQQSFETAEHMHTILVSNASK